MMMFFHPPQGFEDAGNMLLNNGWVRWNGVGSEAVTKMTQELDRLKLWRPDELDRGTGQRRPFIMTPKSILERCIFNASRIPASRCTAEATQIFVNLMGIAVDNEVLQRWVPNRLVVNKMHTGGEIFAHRDVPRYAGVLAVISCQSADFKCAGTEMELAPGDITLMLAQDFAEQQGVEQPEHAVVNHEQRRYSVVVTEDRQAALRPAA